MIYVWKEREGGGTDADRITSDSIYSWRWTWTFDLPAEYNCWNYRLWIAFWVYVVLTINLELGEGQESMLTTKLYHKSKAFLVKHTFTEKKSHFDSKYFQILLNIKLYSHKYYWANERNK